MRKNIFRLFILLLIFTSCEKNEIVQLGLQGTITGSVYTYDEFGIESDDYSGITVTLEGSDPEISTITDSDGYYELTDIPSGTYNIIASKDGYGDDIYQGQKVVGGDLPLEYNLYLCEIPDTEITSLAVESFSGYYINVSGIVNHNFAELENSGYDVIPYVRFYISEDPDVSNRNYEYYYARGFSGDSGTIMDTSLYNDYDSGTTIYIVAYGCQEYDYSSYFDILDNKYYYTAENEVSNTVSAIVP